MTLRRSQVSRLGCSSGLLLLVGWQRNQDLKLSSQGNFRAFMGVVPKASKLAVLSRLTRWVNAYSLSLASPTWRPFNLGAGCQENLSWQPGLKWSWVRSFSLFPQSKEQLEAVWCIIFVYVSKSKMKSQINNPQDPTQGEL